MFWNYTPMTSLNSSISDQDLSDETNIDGDVGNNNIKNLSLHTVSPWRIFFVCYKCLFPVLCLLGVAVNVLTIKVLKQLGFKNFNNIITSAMAVSDLFCPLTNLFIVASDIVKDFDLVWHCYLQLARIVFINHWKYRAWYFSIHLMALLGVERVAAVWLPLMASRAFRPVRMKYAIAGLLIAVSILSMPDLYLYYDYHFNSLNKKLKATPSVLSLMFYTQVTTAQLVCKIVAVIIPLAVIFVCSAILYCSLPLRYNGSHRNNENLNSRNDGSITMFVVFTMKFVMLIPFSVLHLLTYFVQSEFMFSPNGIKIIDYTQNMFNVLFSSTNFLVHVSLDAKFSAICKQMFFSVSTTPR